MRSVIIIDDDIEDIEMMCNAFSSFNEGLKCISFEDALSAINYLRDVENEIPVCIYIDVNMPRLNGVDCLNSIKAFRHLDPVTIVMMSSAFREGDGKNLHMLGANFLFVKPHSFDGYEYLIRTTIDPNRQD